MQDGEHKAGWLDPMRRMGESVLALVQNRFELAGVELQEEKLRALTLFVWLAFAVALGTAGFLLALGTVALLLYIATGSLAGLAAGLAGLAVLALIAGAAVLQSIRRAIHAGPMPFAGTVAEFKKDRDLLRPKP